jgi:hypothetical protein
VVSEGSRASRERGWGRYGGIAPVEGVGQDRWRRAWTEGEASPLLVGTKNTSEVVGKIFVNKIVLSKISDNVT